jgi:hypothetical protein
LQENRLTGREFRQNQLPEFATFSLKNLQILDFSQPTRKDSAGQSSAAAAINWLMIAVDPTSPFRGWAEHGSSAQAFQISIFSANLDGIVDLNSKISNRTLNFRMAQ